MESRKFAEVVPINVRSQKTTRAGQDELGRFKQCQAREGLQIDRVTSSAIDAYLKHLEQARDGLGSRLFSGASIRLQGAVLAGFYLWLKGNLGKEGK